MTQGAIRIPRLCHHRSSGRGYVTDPRSGKELYFGAYGSAACHDAYDRWVGRFRARATVSAAVIRKGCSIARLVMGFLRHADTHYRKAGERTSEYDSYVAALTPLNDLYGDTEADGFGPMDLKAVRGQYIAKGWKRGWVNAQTSRLRRVFRWGVEEELVPAMTLTALEAVQPLAKGRTTAPEGKKVQPVPADVLAKTLAVMTNKTALRVRVHYLLGCRPGELVRMRPCELERVGEVWLYRPARHKTEHHEDSERVIRVGAQAQALLLPLLDRCRPNDYVFRGRIRSRHVTVRGYGVSVKQACKRAGVARWTPAQLRHTRLTDVRRRYGIEAAQAIAGHASIGTTEVYAARLEELAERVAREIG